MLYYAEFGLSRREVPGETALCIYISGCANQCCGCHYPELQQAAFGDPLREHYSAILALYQRQASCVCFLGEGGRSIQTQRELLDCIREAKAQGYKVCLYSGRDIEPEDWMGILDFVKTGSYRKERGALCNKSTNQRFYQKTKDGFEDITSFFWSE